MTLLGNILWFLFGGVFMGLGYILGGLIICLTIVGIPFGLQSVKLGVAVFFPFGREVVEREHANSTLNVVLNVVWILLFGWEIALAHLALAIVLGLTLIGIPFAIQHIKLIPLAILPFGREFRDVQDHG